MCSIRTSVTLSVTAEDLLQQNQPCFQILVVLTVFAVHHIVGTSGGDITA